MLQFLLLILLNLGILISQVIGCLALAWTLVALSLVKGMQVDGGWCHLKCCHNFCCHSQSYGKLTYFITLFPYLVLTTFLVMGSFEEGFAEGITEYYLKVHKSSYQKYHLKVLKLPNESTKVATKGTKLAIR